MEGKKLEKWSWDEVAAVYRQQLLPLIWQAGEIHRNNHNPYEVQVNSLISVKTGGCPEDCSYCPQAARYHTDIEAHPLLSVESVLEMAENAKGNGASRVCLGAAWRQVKDNNDFDRVCEMVEKISAMDMEVCATLGMLNEDQAARLKESGLYAYNHNLDTGEGHYDKIISTRTYGDRLKTLQNVRKAKLTVCCGGIIGMGEKEEDRISLLVTLANMDPYPESVPVNALVAVAGTPLEDQKRVSIWEMVRMIATARIIMPKTMVRISAGRNEMSWMEQALCFLSGANSIFAGDKLLTTPNPGVDQDEEMFKLLGLSPLAGKVVREDMMGEMVRQEEKKNEGDGRSFAV